MKKKNTIIIIDLDKWTTQTDKARNYKSKKGKGTSVEYISKLVRLGKLKSWKIEELNLNLVEK